MSFNNSFDFIFASPVVAITSVVSLACVGILAVKIGSDSDYPDVIGASGGYSSVPVLHREQISGDSPSSFLEAGNNQKQFEQDERSDSAADNAARRALLPSSNGRVATSYKNGNLQEDGGWQENTDEVFSESGLTSEDYSYDTAQYNHPGFSIYSGNTTSTTTTVSNDTSPSTDTDDASIAALDPAPEAIPDSVEQSCDAYPSSIEQVIQIDFDVTQTISCQAIESCGLPCMCTLTTTDASDTSDSIPEILNNCS